MSCLDIQVASSADNLPTEAQFQYWIDAVSKEKLNHSEIVIRIVDEDEMIEFNQQYRKINGSTNILSFPFEAPENVESHLLGDLLVCAPVIEQESLLQNKELEHHWAHMIVHGVLHLLGYDHLNDSEAEEMENLEVQILKTININNPYLEKITHV